MPTRAIHRWPLSSFLVLCAAAGLAQAQSSSQAQALPFTPTFTIGSTTLTNDEVLANADGSFTLIGQQQGGPKDSPLTWDLEWNITVKQDPFIVGSFTVTNLSSETRNYSIELGLPISPAFSPSLFGGSLSATLLDGNGTGTAGLGLHPNWQSIYRGTIDGVTVLSLFAMDLACAGSGACTTSSSDSWGLPGPSLAGPAVNSTIGTFLNFSLTAGDRVTFSSLFSVEPTAPVPLPAALPLLVLGLGTLAARRALRRRPEDAPATV